MDYLVLFTPFLFLISLYALTCICLRLCEIFGQKTRTPQQRRGYIGPRARPSLTQQEPTIYVSPANLPPPPKYEAMAPPSYEEVVGIHYPGYQPPMPVQPISAPINAAMAQATTFNNTRYETSASSSNNQSNERTGTSSDSDSATTGISSGINSNETSGGTVNNSNETTDSPSTVVTVTTENGAPVTVATS